MMADLARDALVPPAAGAQAEHLGQRQAGAEGADLEEVAPRDAVAEPLAGAPECQHVKNPLFG